MRLSEVKDVAPLIKNKLHPQENSSSSLEMHFVSVFGLCVGYPGQLARRDDSKFIILDYEAVPSYDEIRLETGLALWEQKKFIVPQEKFALMVWYTAL